MMAVYNPGSVRIRNLQIAGQPYDPFFVKELSITESLLRSFQTLEMIILDSRNVLNRFLGTGIEGGEDVYLVFEEANGGQIYETRLKLHSITEQENVPGTANSQKYKINAVGLTFYGNRVGGRIQQSFRNVVGSEAIKTIHDEYLSATDAPFEVDPSKGFIGETEPFIISNETPFQAIHKIRSRLTSDEYNTGAYCYYRDNQTYKLRQIEKMFAELTPTEAVTDDPTLGASLSDYRRVARNLLSFTSGTSFTGPGGVTSPFQAFGTNTRTHTNYFNFGEGYNRGIQEDPTPGRTAGTVRLSRGSREATTPRQYNIFPGDPRLNLIDPVQEKSSREMFYAATLMAGPSFTGKVMIDAGIRMTVGKGIFADLSAPSGAQNLVTENGLRGNYLIVNLKHTVKFYNTAPMGVTVFEAIKGGFN